MSSLSALIDFLVGLMRDEDAHQAFEQNPQAELASKGLAGVTGQDVRDARMIMRDDGGLRPTSGSHGSSHGGSDPVREIHHTTTHYQVDEHYQHVDQTINLINIDDRDTTVVDSFNSNDNNDTDVVAIQDNSHDTTIEVDDSFNDEPDDEPDPAAPDPAESGPAESGLAEPEPEVSIDPVEDVPGDEPIPVEPVEDDPVVSIQPVDDEPDLDVDHHAVEAAVI